jgi:hypothetical protein
MADARALKLHLVSPFGGHGEIIHDWNYILHQLGWLSHDTMIASVVRWGGFATMTAGVLWGAWTLWLIVISRHQGRVTRENWIFSPEE